MKNGKAEYAWEHIPWEDDDYAIYVNRYENHPDPGEPSITISNQMDCQESFSFSDIPSIDAFIGRLKEARKWLLAHPRQHRHEPIADE